MTPYYISITTLILGISFITIQFFRKEIKFYSISFLSFFALFVVAPSLIIIYWSRTSFFFSFTFPYYTSIVVLILGITFIVTQLFRKKIRFYSISFLSSFALSVLAPSLIIIYYFAHISCYDGCYLKKYTPYWFATMNRSTIGNLPIINSIEDVKYHYKCEFEKWEVIYKSKDHLDDIKAELEDYLVQKNGLLNAKISCYNGVWDFNDETIKIRCKSSQGNCIIIFLDDKQSYVLVRALEMH